MLAAAAITAIVAIACGAFAAHVLRERLAARDLEIFETAARYQMYGALGMAACALAARLGLRRAVGAGWVMLAGVAVFSGSLYALALSGVKVLGAITPIGGVLMMAGWLLLAIAALARQSHAKDTV
ncbi:MAG: DUF423 domain-containing protein [Kofleriaceae bacterium]|nr:DUF423 domain-containing protein [Myxococcales bacterium]MCB9559638.1 DUF423 domain-containing protein [Kofleriaceae bacterium]MCB9574945.1 DUF423 domain-containing protein [Kofleriaceae bacterium]